MITKKTKADLEIETEKLFKEYRTSFFTIPEGDRKNDDKLKVLKTKIITDLWLYLKEFEAHFTKLTKHTNEQSGMIDNLEYTILDEYSDKIVKTIQSCLSNFLHKNDDNLCGYVFTSVKNCLKNENFSENISEKNMSHISQVDSKYLNNIRKLKRLYESRGINDRTEQNKHLCTDLNISNKKLENLLLLENGTQSNTVKTELDPETSILDSIEDSQNISTEIRWENKEIFEEYFDCATSLWFGKKKKSKMISELFTVSILAGIKKGFYTEFMDESLPSLLFKYDIFDKSILANFFNDQNYLIPNDVMISKKYGVNKNAASQARKRFLEEIESKIHKNNILYSRGK